jgi:hypothetical protein
MWASDSQKSTALRRDVLTVAAASADKIIADSRIAGST